MHKTRNLASIVMLLYISNVFADITLDQVVSIVLTRNLSIQIGNQQVHRSEAAIQQEAEKFDWALSADVGYIRHYVPESVDGFLTTETDTNNVLSSQLGFSKQLRNGMSISPQIKYFLDENDDTSEVLSQSVNRAHIYLNIPMMRGSGERISTAGLRSANALLEAVKYERNHTLSMITTNAVLAYWQCIYASNKHETLKSSYAHARAFANILQERAENGELDPTSYRKARASLIIKKLEINRSELEITAARRELAYMLDMDFDSDEELPKPQGAFPETGGDANGIVLDDKKLLDRALNNRLDLKALANKQQSNKIRLEVTRDSRQPKLDLLLDTDGVLLQYQKTLGDNGSTGSALREQTDVVEISLEIRKLKKAIHRDILYLLDAIQTAKENIGHARDSVKLFESLALSTKDRILIGEADQAGFSELQNEIENSKLILLAALKDYASNIALLRRVTGTIGLEEDISPQEISRRFLSLSDLEQP